VPPAVYLGDLMSALSDDIFAPESAEDWNRIIESYRSIIHEVPPDGPADTSYRSLVDALVHHLETSVVDLCERDAVMHTLGVMYGVAFVMDAIPNAFPNMLAEVLDEKLSVYGHLVTSVSIGATDRTADRFKP